MNFEDVKRRIGEREALERQGKVLYDDALYELQEEFGVLPSDVEEKLRAAREGGQEEEPALGELVAALMDWLHTQTREMLTGLCECRAFVFAKVAAAAPPVVAVVQPLGIVSATFLRPDRSTIEGNVELLQAPRFSPDGELVISVRISEEYCDSAATVAVAVLARPAGTLIDTPVPAKAGQAEVLSLKLSPELRDAWIDIAKMELEQLPMHFVVYGPPPLTGTSGP